MCCVNKMSYETRQEAETAGRLRHIKLFTYTCPECGLVHLTRAERKPAVAAKLHPVPAVKPKPTLRGNEARPARGITLGEMLAMKGFTI